MAYYKRIRELREDSDKTQREVAEYLGTPYQYYAVYEKGGSEISFERAIALARYYNVSLDYIAELTDTKRSPAAPAGKSAVQELLGELNALSESDRKTLVRFLRTLIKAL